MASNSNRRSGSSGSNDRGAQQGRPPRQMNRQQAGRYAKASQTSSTAFSERLERSRTASPDRRRASTPQSDRPVGASGRTARDARSVPADRPSARSRTGSPSVSSRPRASAGSAPYVGGQTRTGARDGGASRTQRPSAAPRTGQRTDRPRAQVSTVTGGRYAQLPRDARRVGDLRTREREERLHQSYRRHLLRLLLVFAIALALVGGGFAIYNSSLFSITSVEVTGTHILSEDDVTELAAIPEGETLLRLDRGAVCDRLLSNPWIGSAEVHWSLPHGVSIVVHERQVAARVQIPMSALNGNVTTWAISSDGLWLSQVDGTATAGVEGRIATDAAAVPLIKDIASTTMPAEGQTSSDEGIRNALQILSTISTDLSGQIVSISAPSVEQTDLVLGSGVTIAFGSATDAQAKERVVLQLLEEHAGSISYINVRVVDRPAWRGLATTS